jgi:hypothetical protein
MSEPFETVAGTFGIALFEERLILRSKPPITEAAVAEIVTTATIVFEWLESAEHPRFRDAIALIK